MHLCIFVKGDGSGGDHDVDYILCKQVFVVVSVAIVLVVVVVVVVGVVVVGGVFCGGDNVFFSKVWTLPLVEVVQLTLVPYGRLT